MQTPSDCHEGKDFSILADGSRLCNYYEGKPHCICENMVRFENARKGLLMRGGE